MEGRAEEEEHRKRLDHSNLFFQSFIEKFQDGPDQDHTESHLEFEERLLSYFHDFWSVIRNNAYKFLSKISVSLNIEQIESLFLHFRNSFQDEESRSWQDIHGSILGFMALLSVLSENKLSNIETLSSKSHLEEISVICFQHIGHIRNPIRDACKDCLVMICNKSNDPQNFLIKLLEVIKLKSSSHLLDNESETLELDGLLSCLSELVPLLETIILQKIHQHEVKPSLIILSTSSEIKNCSSLFSLREFLVIIKACMLHNASTVRQKGGNIIKKLFLGFMMRKEENSDLKITSDDINDAINDIIDNLLIQILNIHSLEYWNGHEVCLMICEELIRDFLNIYLNSLKDNNSGLSPTISTCRLPIQEIHKLLTFLHGELVVLLCHPRFEVRRVILQLIPTAIRGKIVIDTILFDIDSPSDPIVLRSRSITEEESYEKHLKRASLNRHFLPIVEMVWISSFIKENRHFQEVLNLYHPNEAGSNVFGITGENWANEVHGRLLELEIRNEFHGHLVEIMKGSNRKAHSFIVKALLSNDRYLIQLIRQYLEKVEDQRNLSENNSESNPNNSTDSNTSIRLDLLDLVEKSISEKYISMDFVEFYALVECFLHNIKERSYSNLEIEKFSVTSIDLISQGMILIEKIKPHGLAWISILSYLQYSTHQELHPFKEVPEPFNYPTEWSIKLLELIEKEKSESCKHKNSFMILKYWKMGQELSGIHLLPTLTDPTTNPIIYAGEMVLSKSFDEHDPELELEDSPSSKSKVISINLSSNSSEQVSPKDVGISFPETPSKSAKGNYHKLGSPKVLPIASPNKLGVGSNLPVVSNINSFQSMNRWNCEAISPLLFSLSCILPNMHIIALLSGTVIEWIILNFTDPLWLDNRRYSKKILMESLPNLIITISKQIPVHKYQKEYRLLMFFIFKSIHDVLEILCKKKGSTVVNSSLDIRNLQPLIKTAISLIMILMDFPPNIFHELNIVYLILEPESNSDRSLAEKEREYFGSLIDAMKVLIQELTDYFESQLSSSARQSVKASPINPLSFPQLMENCKSTLDESSSEDENEKDEDEFSDWDEEEDLSVHESGNLNLSTTASQSVVLSAFIADLQYLQKQLEIWSNRMDLLPI